MDATMGIMNAAKVTRTVHFSISNTLSTPGGMIFPLFRPQAILAVSHGVGTAESCSLIAGTEFVFQILVVDNACMWARDRVISGRCIRNRSAVLNPPSFDSSQV